MVLGYHQIDNTICFQAHFSSCLLVVTKDLSVTWSKGENEEDSIKKVEINSK